mmetsp:Transcript_94226/g.281190  ORF Transcript_94226/g.281190 Transcript_94226/m.281190 type:complete len:228 (+) Transcript_94226:711-1394(+)
MRPTRPLPPLGLGRHPRRAPGGRSTPTLRGRGAETRTAARWPRSAREWALPSPLPGRWTRGPARSESRSRQRDRRSKRPPPPLRGEDARRPRAAALRSPAASPRQSPKSPRGRRCWRPRWRGSLGLQALTTRQPVVCRPSRRWRGGLPDRSCHGAAARRAPRRCRRARPRPRRGRPRRAGCSRCRSWGRRRPGWRRGRCRPALQRAARPAPRDAAGHEQAPPPTRCP